MAGPKDWSDKDMAQTSSGQPIPGKDIAEALETIAPADAVELMSIVGEAIEQKKIRSDAELIGVITKLSLDNDQHASIRTDATGALGIIAKEAASPQERAALLDAVLPYLRVEGDFTPAAMNRISKLTTIIEEMPALERTEQTLQIVDMIKNPSIPDDFGYDLTCRILAMLKKIMIRKNPGLESDFEDGPRRDADTILAKYRKDPAPN
jgi:hypothetical protein